MENPQNALSLLRAKEYDKAYRAYKEILDSTPADEYRYRNLNNILICIYFVYTRSKEQAMFTQFKNRLFEYLDIARKTDTVTWANNIIEELLHYTIDTGLVRFTENNDPFTRQAPHLKSWLADVVPGFIKALTIEGKRDARLFYDVIIREIFRERANFRRRGNNYQNVVNTKNLIHFFFDLTQNADDLDRSRSNLFLLLSELAYSDPEAEDQNYYFLTRRAVDFLDKSLEAYPGNSFAHTRRSQLIDSLTVQEQLHRFDHDVNSKISSLTSLVDRTRKKAPDMKEPVIMEQVIRDMEVILSLSRNQGPEPEDVDLKEFFKTLTSWSPVTISVSFEGEAKLWLSDRGYLKIIFENLILNSKEAYERRNIPVPDPAVTIDVDYDRDTVTFKDFAGGIPEDLLRNNRVFDPYVSEKGVAQNTGLGLSLVKKACDMMELSIDISVSRASTIFIIRSKIPQ